MANNRIVVQQGQAAGAILGAYDIFGTNAGAETVTVFDGTTANFQGDFARGGDVIRIADVAGDFTVALSGSNIVLTSASDGITVRIPVGTVGTRVVFENSAGQLVDERSLVFNGSSVVLGTQIVTAIAASVTGGDQGNNPTTTVLTSGQDVLNGAGSADTYVAQNTNLNAGDIIDGGNGADRLRVFADRSLVQAVYAGFELSNIETLEFTNDSNGLGSFDLSSSSGLETLVNRNSTQAVEFNQLAGLANLVIENLTDSITSSTTVEFQNSVVAGSADAVTVSLNNTNASTIRIGSVDDDNAGIETLNLVVSGRATKVGEIDSDITTLNLSGTQNLTIADALNSTIKTVSGAAYTGNVSLSVAGAAAGVTIDLGSGKDTVTGSSNDDTINVRGGNNNVTAGDGNDTVTAGDGANVINAGAGDDQVTVGNGANTIVTGNGENSVFGGNGANTVTGGDNADTIDLGNGANVVSAGEGENSVSVGDGANAVTTGNDADIVVAGDGGNEIITNNGNDTITAGDGNDLVVAGNGNDDVFAGGGDDTVDAGPGDDFVVAGAGNDVVFIGTGIDTVRAGDGNDTINAVLDFDADGTLDDEIYVTDRDSIDGGADRDTLEVSAGAVDNNFRFVSNVEILSVTTAGTTTLSTLAQRAGIDQVDALNAGDDVVDAVTFTSGLTINLAGGDDEVRTGSGNDVFNIASFNNDDTLNAGAGQDTLNLDADTDIGTDAFTGFEAINLGSGRGETTDGHVYSFELDGDNKPNPNTGAQGQILTIDGSALAADTDGKGALVAETLSVDADLVSSYRLDITGGAAADRIIDGGLSDTISTGGGEDAINLTSGNNVVDAGADNDTVTLGIGADNVSGGTGDDSFEVTGGNLSAADTISGGAGANELLITGNSVDAAYTNVSEVQTLRVFGFGAATTTTLAAEAEQAGILRVNLDNGDDTLDASGYSAAANLTVLGGDGDDAITTGAGADSVRAAEGDDTVNTGAGADYVAARSGDDVVNTGEGDDIVELGIGDDAINLGSGNDVVKVSAVEAGTDDELDFADTITGGTGDDEILLNNSSEIVAGINLNTVTGVETVRVGLDGESVAVTFTGGNVTTLTTVTVDATAISAGESAITTVTIDAGQSDSDYSFVVSGGDSRDVLVKLNSGVNNNIVFNAGGGGDEVRMQSGQDLGSTTFLSGGDGTDSIVLLGGFVNDDSFVSVSSFERLAAEGADLRAQLGASALASGLQTIDADNGNFNDNILLDARFTGPLEVTVGGGVDVVNAGASVAAITFNANGSEITAADTLTGGKSANDVVYLTADDSVANFDGSSGIEQFIVVENGDDDIGIVLTDGSFRGVASNTINVDASDLDDAVTEGGLLLLAGGVSGTLEVTGGTGSDTIQTGSGSDFISTGLRDDAIDAGEGDNSISAGDGDDAIFAGAGNDTIDAGAGNDFVSAGNGDNVVDLGEGDDYVETGTGNDIITNDGGNNTVRSGGGADDVTLSDGNNDVDTSTGADKVSVGNGNNEINVGAGNDTVTAGEGDNVIVAGDGNDTITVGDNGSNTITGGQGVDRIVLGDGKNTVRFLQVSDSFGLAATRDTVIGFDSDDTITIETNVLARGVTTLNYVGDAEDSQEAQLGINASAGDGKADAVYDISTGRLLIDVNDDGILDARDLAISFQADGGRAPGGFLSQGQFKVIDSVAPKALGLDLRAASDTGNSASDDLTNASPVTVRVSFDNSSVDGSAALAGDKITLTNATNAATVTHTLVGADITAGFVDLTIALDDPGVTVSTNELTALLQDAAGNTSAVSLNVDFDDTRPNITIADFDGADSFVSAAEDNAVVISGTASIDTAGNVLTVSVTDGTNPPVTGTATVNAFGSWSTAALDLSGLNNGPLTVSASVVDKAGNTSVAATGALSTTLDNVLPTVTITNDQAGAVANIAGGVVEYTFTFSEPVTGFSAADVSIVNGAAVGAVSGGPTVYTLQVLPTANFEGNMTVSVAGAVAIDRAENPNVASVPNIQAVDTIAPTLEIGTPIMGDGRINAEEDEVTVVGGKFTNAEAGQQVTVTFIGNVGGRGVLPVTTTAVVNNDGTWATSTVDLDAKYGLSSELGDILFVEARLSDKAGNEVQGFVEVNFDNNRPDTVFADKSLEQETNTDPGSNAGDTVPDGTTNDTLPDVSFTYDIALEAGDIMQVSLGGDWITLTSDNSSIDTALKIVTLKNVPLSVGTTTIDMRVVDAAGNAGSGTPSTVITLDTTAPNPGAVSWVSVTEESNTKNSGDSDSTDGITKEATADVVFSYAGPALGGDEKFQYSVDGGTLWRNIGSSDVNTTASTVTVKSLDVTGSPTVQIRAIDNAGNETTTVLASKAITYDNTAPGMTGMTFVSLSGDTDDKSSADNITNQSPVSVVFNYAGTDLTSSQRLQYSTDGTTWVEGTFALDTTAKTATLSGLTVTKDISLQIRAIDVAGNETLTLVTQAITYDTTAPAVDTVKYNNATDTFTFTGKGFDDTNGKATADLTKIGWDVDGNGTADYFLPAEAAGSSKVSIDSDTQITVTLTREAAAGLEGLTGFSGSVEDKVIIGAGAFNDKAGNNSTAVTKSVSLFLDGTDNADNIYGGSLKDSLSGGLLNDTLTGGLGSDTIKGGSGADIIMLGEDKSIDYVVYGVSFGKSFDGFDNIIGLEASVDKILLDGYVLPTGRVMDGSLGSAVFGDIGGGETDLDGDASILVVTNSLVDVTSATLAADIATALANSFVADGTGTSSDASGQTLVFSVTTNRPNQSIVGLWNDTGDGEFQGSELSILALVDHNGAGFVDFDNIINAYPV